nr:SgcJ/EcaC family oxidoreductase [Burkholderia ambifaria]
MKYGYLYSLVSCAVSIVLVPIAANAQMQSASSCISVTKPQIAALFDRWNESLRSGDPDKVVANYAPDGVLLPTVSNEPRTNPSSIRDYFVKFLKKSPQSTIEKRIIKIGCNVAQDVGTYTFRFADGKAVRARYTYVYEWENGKWLIAHHHSSGMPEKSDE